MTTAQTPRKQLDSRNLIREIRDSDGFGEEIRKPGAKLATAFTNAAFELATLEVSPSGERTLEGYCYLLASQLNGVVDSLVALNRYGIPKKERASHKEKLVDFNHDIRAMIDDYPDVTPAEIQRLLVQAYIAAHRQEWRDEQHGRAEIKVVSDAVASSLYGMWSEVAGELVVQEAGYTIDTDVTTEEELRGIDAWVHMQPELGEDKGWMPVDFKGSREKAQRVNRSGDNNYALWSQFSFGEYSPNSSFRITRERIRTKVPGIQRELSTLYAWYNR